MDKPAPLTDKQLLVLEALRQAEGPVGAYALLERLRPQGFTVPVQIYRALRHLMDLGLVHRLASLNAYVRRTRTDGDGGGFSVFVICDQCGHIREVPGSSLNQRLDDWSRHNGFQPANASFEIHGTCADCCRIARDDP